ncbi:MFS transporter [Krasilnikovia sp. M28-CT-15]|uniref:MFS transporter n=1 Tax=Krasilnikovia sp. M28-CT-15 TaxID=3373540 RepID=UPI00387601F4
MRDTRSVLLVSAGVLFSSANFYLMLPILPLYLIHLSGGEANIGAAGVVLGTSFLVSAVSSPVWGALADRYGPKPMMLRSAVGLAVVYALFPLAHTVTALIVVRLLNGLVAGYVPAAFSLVSRTASQAHLGKAMSSLSVCRAAGALLGPALGGFLVAFGGFDAAFFAAAGSMALAGLLILPVRNFVPTATTADVRNRLHALGPSPMTGAMRMPLLLTVLTVTATTMLGLALPLLLFQADHDSSRVAASVGMLSSLSGLLALLLGVPWGALADRFGYRGILLVVLTASAGLLAVMAVTRGFWQTAAAYLVYSAVQCEISTLLVLYLIALTAEEQRGVAMGLNNTALQLGSAAGPIVASYVAQALGVRSAFWLSGLLLAVCTVLFVAFGRRVPAPQADPETEKEPA